MCWRPGALQATNSALTDQLSYPSDAVAAIECQTRAVWDDAYQRIYRVALHAGDPGPDAALAGLQGEARRRLPTAHLLSRVAVSALAV